MVWKEADLSQIQEHFDFLITPIILFYFILFSSLKLLHGVRPYVIKWLAIRKCKPVNSMEVLTVLTIHPDDLYLMSCLTPSDVQ